LQCSNKQITDFTNEAPTTETGYEL